MAEAAAAEWGEAAGDVGGRSGVRGHRQRSQPARMVQCMAD